MDIDKLQGIRTKKKWYYNDLGEKVDYVTEVYFIEDEDQLRIIYNLIRIKKMGLVHSCLSLIRVGKRKEAERLYSIYKMLKEINKESKDKPPFALQEK